MEPAAVSIKGMTFRALYIAWKQAGMAMCPKSVDGLRKATINRHHSNTSGVANKQKLFDERRYGGIILLYNDRYNTTVE